MNRQKEKTSQPVSRKRGRGGGSASTRSGRTPARRRYIQDMAEESSAEDQSSSSDSDSSGESSDSDSHYDSSFVDDSGCELEDATFYRLLDLAQSEVRAAAEGSVPVHVTRVPPQSSSSLLDEILETSLSPNEASPSSINGPSQPSSSSQPQPTGRRGPGRPPEPQPPSTSADNTGPARRGPGRPRGATNQNPTAASRARDNNTPLNATSPTANRRSRSRGARAYFESPIEGEEYLPRATAPAFNVPLLKIQPDEMDEVTNSFWPGDEVNQSLNTHATIIMFRKFMLIIG